jgi:two-component system OmpR family response regulator
MATMLVGLKQVCTPPHTLQGKALKAVQRHAAPIRLAALTAWSYRQAGLQTVLFPACARLIENSRRHRQSGQQFQPDLTMALITYLAEDNQAILESLIETLEEIADVKVAAHAVTQAEASRWLELQDGKWHLAIVDLFLQEGSGLGVLAGCRHREPYQKVVVLTNYATPEIRTRAAELGADAVFDKATELDALYAYCAEQTRNISREDVQQAQREAVASAAAPLPT